MTKSIFISILILYVMHSFTVHAKVYKFVDKNGQVHYSQKKPVKMGSQRLDVGSGHVRKKIKLIRSKDLDKAVREGKITESIATRMRHYNFVSKEYSLLKKKKKAMKLAIAAAKSKRSHVPAEQIKELRQQYNNFVKEEYYYGKRNYMVSRKKIRELLGTHNEKRPRSLSRKKQGVSLEWR